MLSVQPKPTLDVSWLQSVQIVQMPCFVCAFTAFGVLISRIGLRLPL